MIFTGGEASIEAKTPKRSAPGAQGAGKLPDGGAHFKPLATQKVNLIQGLRRPTTLAFNRGALRSGIKSRLGRGDSQDRVPAPDR